jgi:hypothetical protein
MPSIALADAQPRLASWLAAVTAVSTGLAYRIGNRPMKRADLEMIGDRVTYWNAIIVHVTADRWRYDTIRTRELVHVLRDKLALAGAPVGARGLETPADEHRPAGGLR